MTSPWTACIGAKAGVLRVLQRSENPPRPRLGERHLASVTKRTYFGGSMHTASHTARNVLFGSMKPCRKLKVPLLPYLGGRLHTPGAIVVLALPDLVPQAATMA